MFVIIYGNFKMFKIKSLMRFVNNSKNLLAVTFAGSLVFLGSQMLDYWALDSAMWTMAILIMAVLAVRPILEN